jgi:hypothetical protein
LKYRYQASETFWREFYRLPAKQKEAVRQVWDIFRQDPFAPSLGVHKIHSLSSLYKKTVHSVVIEKDLRAVFYLEDDTVYTVDIGTHAIYG